MKLTGIVDIYRDMKNQSLNRCQFEFTYAKLDFDVILKIDCNPFILMFGVKINNEYFEIPLKKGFEIDPSFDSQTYNMLVKLFDFSGKSFEPFKPIHFFKALNESIPKKMKPINKYRPIVVARYKRVVDEADKIYFKGWINHEELKTRNPEYSKNVTPENLEKTRTLLSEKAYIRCKEDNISSKWTDIPSKEKLDEINKYEQM